MSKFRLPVDCNESLDAWQSSVVLGRANVEIADRSALFEAVYGTDGMDDQTNCGCGLGNCEVCALNAAEQGGRVRDFKCGANVRWTAAQFGDVFSRSKLNAPLKRSAP